MISNFLRAQELAILANEFDQPVCFSEFRRQTRPTPAEKISPDSYRSLFRISEFFRVAYEVARENGVEDPFAALRRASSDKPNKGA